MTKQLVIQDAYAINPKTAATYRGDVYEEEKNQFFIHHLLGRWTLDKALMRKENNGCFYLKYKGEIPVLQGINPEENPFLYIPDALTLYEENATLQSPYTGKEYRNGRVYSYKNIHDELSFFYLGQETGPYPVCIDVQNTNFEEHPTIYQLLVIYGLPVLQNIYPSWESVLK